MSQSDASDRDVRGGKPDRGNPPAVAAQTRPSNVLEKALSSRTPVFSGVKTTLAATRKNVNRARNIAGRLMQGTEGRRRARRLLALRLLRGEADSVAFHRDRISWTIPVGDRIISKVLFETGGFQLDELQGLVGWLEANDSRWSDKDWILDVGANIGTSSIPLALETGRRVLALEPDPSTFGYLQTNVAANDLQDQVICVQVAISTRAGKIKMVVDPASSGSTEVWEVGMPCPANALIDVDAKTLDDVLSAQGISPNPVALEI